MKHHKLKNAAFTIIFITSMIINVLIPQSSVNAEVESNVGNGGDLSIGDYVWEDADESLIPDSYEKGLADVIVTLYDEKGEVISSIVTEADGLYKFNNLKAGAYTIVFDAPDLYQSSTGNKENVITKTIELSDSNVDSVDVGYINVGETYYGSASIQGTCMNENNKIFITYGGTEDNEDSSIVKSYRFADIDEDGILYVDYYFNGEYRGKVVVDIRDRQYTTRDGASITYGDVFKNPSLAPKCPTPTTEEPTTEAATTEEPTTEAATTEEPTTEAATTEEPTPEAATTEKPTTEAATTEKPTPEAATTEKPTPEAATTEKPTTEAVTTEKPTTEAVTTEKPTPEAATTEKPTTETATTEKPTTEAVTTEKPTPEAVTTERPTPEAATTEKPTTEAATPEKPTTEAATTERPTPEAATTERPTPEAATTEKPTTEEPTTEVPVIPDTDLTPPTANKPGNSSSVTSEIPSSSGHNKTVVNHNESDLPLTGEQKSAVVLISGLMILVAGFGLMFIRRKS